ncbi:MAG: ATP synthase F1 subunit gamma [Ruminococcus sp.]|nr:ATP synthase F1 subunit gamma [Ruminococcus sp.]
MGADIKKLKGRIRSIDSTLHLTKAMGLVASSKIRKANDAMNAANDYAEAAGDIIRRLAAEEGCRSNKYLRKPEEPFAKRILIVVAGDRGLAGGYNAGIFRTLRDNEDTKGTEIIPIGKKACDKLGCEGGYASAENFSFENASELSDKLCRAFAEGETDCVEVLCTEYINMMTHQPRIVRLFPLEKGSEKDSGGTTEFEPNEDKVMNTFMSDYITGMLTALVRESFASEVAARRVAMDNAGKNAQQMIDDLKLEYNRARQSIITQEITEIVAGAGEN